MNRFKKNNENPNYLCTFCKIGEVFPIEGADKLVKTVVNGYDIIISKDHKEGDIVIYFPVESSINEMYLSANNLFERSEFERNANADAVKEYLIELENAEASNDTQKSEEISAKIKSMCGFFGKNGRVRILKLRGQYSQGFIAGVDSLVNYDSTLKDTDWESLVGTQFNYIDDNEFCKKYVPPIRGRGQQQNHPSGNQSIWKKRMKKIRKFNRLVDGQFVFHYDTKMLAEHINEFTPDDIVSVTVKVHGTSIIMSNIIVNRQLTTWEKIKKFFGIKVPMYEYGNVYSSRGVIKNKYINQGVTPGYYGCDIYGCVNRDFSPYIGEGLTVYGEVVGYLENSTSMIQKLHDYGCKLGQWKFMPYRITETDEFGNKKEWEIKDVDAWTHKLVEEHPELAEKVLFLNFVYYGRFGDMYPDIPEDENWNKNVLARMKVDKDLILMELDEPMCKNKVPREGVVVRIENDKFSRAWKLKSLRHYGKEAEAHDKGEVDLEECEANDPDCIGYDLIDGVTDGHGSPLAGKIVHYKRRNDYVEQTDVNLLENENGQQ